MTENEAREFLSRYRKYDEESGSEYGFQILELIQRDGDGFLFRCRPDDCDITCVLAVYPGGTVLIPPFD